MNARVINLEDRVTDFAGRLFRYRRDRYDRPARPPGRPVDRAEPIDDLPRHSLTGDLDCGPKLISSIL